MNETLEQLEIERAIIAKLRNEQDNDGWRVSLSLDDVPAEVGHYAFDDGLRGWGGGVSHDMRRSLDEFRRRRECKRPIYRWKPDTDGSAALWLDGKVRCSHCDSQTVLDLIYADEHYSEVHGIRDDEDREF